MKSSHPALLIFFAALLSLAAMAFNRIQNLRVAMRSESYTLSSAPVTEGALAKAARIAVANDAYVGLIAKSRGSAITACLPSDRTECVHISFGKTVETGVVNINCISYSTQGHADMLADQGMRMARSDLAKAAP